MPVFFCYNSTTTLAPIGYNDMISTGACVIVVAIMRWLMIKSARFGSKLVF